MSPAELSQLSVARGCTTIPLLTTTIGGNLRATVARYGDSDVMVSRHQNSRMTYREFWELIDRVARALIALGVNKGDRVGIWSPNRLVWPIVQFATARIGAILVNINPSYRASELEYALNQSGVSVMFMARRFRSTDYEPIWDEVQPRCDRVHCVIRLDCDWDGFVDSGKGVTDHEVWEREKSLHCHEPINIQYTSGTTGRPKGATLTHSNILNNGYFIGRALRYSDHDRVCLPVPYYHCFGMVLGSLASVTHGACMVLPSESFDPSAVLQSVQAERCTSLYGVPTMFVAILEHPRFGSFDVTSLRTGIMAGAPCPLELMRQVVDRLHMTEVAIGYGMTELSPITNFTAADDPLEYRVGSVGRVFDHVEAKIIDPATQQVVARNQPGEFCARGYGVMHGYWNDPQATAAAIDCDGFMHTGDLATMDDAGYCRIVGRIKDIIIRGGENISPREVEDYLLTHPAVSEAQVIGVPDPKYGEEVMAWVKLKPGAEVTQEQLRDFCMARIARFKVPRYWKFVCEFPMTVTGKIQKFRMREIAQQELNGPES